MSCEKYEQEIFESFGMNIISGDLQSHLEACETCKKMYEHMKSISTGIGSDELFYDSDVEIEERVEAVNKKIDELELSKVISPAKWKSYVPMAAALLIVLGVGLISRILLHTSDSQNLSDNANNEVALVSLNANETKTLNEIELSEFVDQYSTEYTLENEMSFFGDISEEEYQYLEENLNVGEIL